MAEGFDVILSFTYLVFGVLPMFALFALSKHSDNRRKKAEEEIKKMKTVITNYGSLMEEMT